MTFSASFHMPTPTLIKKNLYIPCLCLHNEMCNSYFCGEAQWLQHWHLRARTSCGSIPSSHVIFLFPATKKVNWPSCCVGTWPVRVGKEMQRGRGEEHPKKKKFPLRNVRSPTPNDSSRDYLHLFFWVKFSGQPKGGFVVVGELSETYNWIGWLKASACLLCHTYQRQHQTLKYQTFFKKIYSAVWLTGVYCLQGNLVEGVVGRLANGGHRQNHGTQNQRSNEKCLMSSRAGF